jgi:predicted ester cyclase
MSTAVLLQQWFDQVWNQANEDSIEQMMHKDAVLHGLDAAGTTQGIESFRQFYKNFRLTFPHVSIELTPLVSDHQMASAYCLVTAKTNNQREINFSGLCVGRYKDNKLVECWNNFDFLKMYQQLGHILVEPISGMNTV